MTSACARTIDVLDAVHDDQLDGRTPCEELPLRAVIAHVGGLGAAFAAAARKDFGELTDTAPGAAGYDLAADWRARYPDHLAELARSWREPDAWRGMTRVGGINMPGDVTAMVALTEVVVHGWDVAVATGQRYRVDDDVAAAVAAHLAGFAADGPVQGLFGAAVAVPGEAPDLHRALGFSGRDPGWHR